MPVIDYPGTSPYSATPQTSWYLERFVVKPVSPDSGDQLFVLLPRHNFRPDTLSYDLYSTMAYWWVFAMRNPRLRKDPIWSFKAGLTIIVPSASYVRQVAGS
jgi:hypothetical protein